MMNIPIITVREKGRFSTPAVGRQQDVASICIDAVLQAREHLRMIDDPPTVIGNLLSAHLAQVLSSGFTPNQEYHQLVSQGPIGVINRIGSASGRRQRLVYSVQLARAALFLHGLRLLNQHRRPATYAQLTDIGRTCYRSAAVILSDEDIEAMMYTAMAGHFEQYSDILNQAGTELGFVDHLPPGLLS